MTVKPTLAFLKAQISQLGLTKKEELLQFLTDDITEQKATGQKSKEASIDDYVKYYPKFIPEDCSMYIMEPGCQQLFRHSVLVSTDPGCGERVFFSFRGTLYGDEDDTDLNSGNSSNL